MLVGALAEAGLRQVRWRVLDEPRRRLLLYARVEEERGLLVIVQPCERPDDPARAVLEAVHRERGLLVQHLVRGQLDERGQVCHLGSQELLVELLLVLEDARELQYVDYRRIDVRRGRG